MFLPHTTPVLKPTVQRNDISRSIFLRTSSRVTEISPNTIYHRIMDHLDGSKTVQEICANLADSGISDGEVISALQDFDDLLLLEDLSIDHADLAADDTERWARNLNFFGSYCNFGSDKYLPQTKIRDCRVTLLGLGGLGSHLLFDLAALGCKDILAVEFDNVELSNLNRQILYTPDDVGKPKAMMASKRIKAFSPDLDFKVFNSKIEGPEDVYQAIKGRDIAICVADRPKTEILYWVNEACVREGIPLITGGLDTQVARYYSTQPDMGCLECWRGDVKQNDPKADEILEEQRRTQLRGDNAAFVPFVALIAGLMVSEFSKIVTGLGGPACAHNQTREIDFSTMEIVTRETWARNESCSCCGAGSFDKDTSALAEA